MKRFCILLVLLLSQQLIFTQNNLYRADSGSISFVSDAPLEFIRASSEELKGIVNPQDNRFAFSVDISTFFGFNSSLQRTHFNENYLESARFPAASFSGKIIEPIDWTMPGIQSVRGKGTLRIHDVTQERIIYCQIDKRDDGVLHVNASFNISLGDHDINIPKIVVQKISEIVTVSLHSRLVQQAALP
ncbi:MAG: YceI family protein [Saprospiraceae bacterium]|nr:YceI family protein [Saprospiraceae bacterium]